MLRDLNNINDFCTLNGHYTLHFSPTLKITTTSTTTTTTTTTTATTTTIIIIITTTTTTTATATSTTTTTGILTKGLMKIRKT